MKKKLLIGLGSVIILGGIFFAGSIVGANLDWKSNAINNAYSGMLDIAAGTTNELTQDVDADINAKVKANLDGTIEEQYAELDRLLREHYEMKLNGFVDTEEFKQLEIQIEQIRQSVFENYSKQIDEAFAGK